VHHHGRASLDSGNRNRLEDPWHVADETVSLDAALEERSLDTRVVDPLAELADEELGDRLWAAIREEVR
jgi:hypothetical protein